FVTDSYRDQLQFAVEVNTQLKGVESGYRDKFRRQIAELDEAEQSLSLVLDDLKAVKVDRVFRSNEQEEDKYLIDFVDDSGIEGLKNGLRGVIDEVEVNDELSSSAPCLLTAILIRHHTTSSWRPFQLLMPIYPV